MATLRDGQTILKGNSFDSTRFKVNSMMVHSGHFMDTS